MKYVVQKRICLLAILFSMMVLLVVPVSSANEKSRDDWAFTLGLGAFLEPEYEGSDQFEIIASPNFEVVWKDRVFLNLDSLIINYYNNDSLFLNVGVSQGEERKESLDTSFNGLGDVEASTTLTLEAVFELELFVPYANLTKHSGGTDGIQALVGVETSFPLRMLTGSLDMASIESSGETEDLSLIGPIIIAGLSADWADDEYTSGFFGVDEMQSVRSGLPQHTAEAGFKSVNLELSVLYPISRSWTVLGFSGYRKLIGDVDNSPIVKADEYVFIGGFVNYHF